MEFDYAKEPGRKLLISNRESDGKPLVSIITPYYNAGKHFKQTFNCVMNQTFPWFEWIIVDDGSTDKPSLDILERLSKQDTRIRVLHQSNQRQAAARNAAIKHSTTNSCCAYQKIFRFHTGSRKRLFPKIVLCTKTSTICICPCRIGIFLQCKI